VVLNDSPVEPVTQTRLPVVRQQELPPPSNLFTIHQPQDCHVNAFSSTNLVNHFHVHSSQPPPSTLKNNPYITKTRNLSEETNPFFAPQNTNPPEKKKKTEFSAEALGLVDPYLVTSGKEAKRKTSTKTRQANKLIWTEQNTQRLKNGYNKGNISCLDLLKAMHEKKYWIANPDRARMGVHESCLNAKWAFNYVMELVEMIHKENPTKTNFLYHKVPNPLSKDKEEQEMSKN
jgi:hypothetical protein